MKIAFAALMLVASVFGQITRVVVATDSGDFTAKPGQVIALAPSEAMLEVHEDYFTITHPGAPRRYNHFQWQPGEPFLFSGLRATVKTGYLPVGHPINGATLVPFPDDESWTWELVNGQKFIPDERSYPEGGTDSNHFLSGGERLLYYFRTAGDIREPSWPLSSDKKETILKRVGFEQSRYHNWPRAKDLMSLYTGTEKSFGKNATKGEGLDLLGRLWPESSSGLPGSDGWYHGGGLMWSEGHTNGHYLGDLHPIINAILTDDAFGYSLGVWVASRGMSLGLVWSDLAGSNYQDSSKREEVYMRGWQHYEKGERYGSYFHPSSYKQWPLATEVVAYATGHPWAIEARDLRRSYWLREAPNDSNVRSRWTGLYGERVGARQLESLQAHWLFDENEENRKRYAVWAEAIMNRGWSFAEQANGTNLWFNEYERAPYQTRRPWMQAQTLKAYWWWINERKIHRDRLPLYTRMVEYFFEVGTSPHPDYPSDWIVHTEIGPVGSDVVRKPGAPSHVSTAINLAVIGKYLGFTTIHRMGIDEAIKMMENTGLGKAGQTTSQLSTPALSIEQLKEKAPSTSWSYRGGLNYALGSSGTKVLNYIAEHSLYHRPVPLID